MQSYKFFVLPLFLILAGAGCTAAKPLADFLEPGAPAEQTGAEQAESKITGQPFTLLSENYLHNNSTDRRTYRGPIGLWQRPELDFFASLDPAVTVGRDQVRVQMIRDNKNKPNGYTDEYEYIISDVLKKDGTTVSLIHPSSFCQDFVMAKYGVYENGVLIQTNTQYETIKRDVLMNEYKQYYERAKHNATVDGGEYYPPVNLVQYRTLCNRFPEIDFSRASIIGKHVQSNKGCSTNYDITLLRDDRNKKIIYRVTHHDPSGVQCLELSLPSPQWFIIDKVPDGYKLVVDERRWDGEYSQRASDLDTLTTQEYVSEAPFIPGAPPANETASSSPAVIFKNDSTRLADVKQIVTALELYRTDHSVYPETGDGWPVMLGSRGLGGECLGADGFGPLGCADPYMKIIPQDPRPDLHRYVYESADGTTYTIRFTLEGNISSLTAGVHSASPDGIR